MLCKAETEDLPFVADLLNRPENLDRLGGWDLAALSKAHVSSDHAIYLWRDATGPLGMIWLRDVQSPRIKIEEFAATRPGSGIGTRLLQAAIAALPAVPVWLNVAEDNLEAQRFYQRQGFTVFARAETLWQRRAGAPVGVLQMERTPT